MKNKRITYLKQAFRHIRQAINPPFLCDICEAPAKYVDVEAQTKLAEIDITESQIAEIEENTVRQNFTASELAAIYKHYQPQIEEQAKERQEELGESYGADPLGKFSLRGRTRDIIGNLAGVSGKTLEKAVKITEIAEQSDKAQKILDQVDKGQRSIDWGYKRAYNIGVKAAELRLRAEARLGELIREMQERGELATPGDNQYSGSNTNVTTTLGDIGLSKIESNRFQRVDLCWRCAMKASQEGLLKKSLLPWDMSPDDFRSYINAPRVTHHNTE